LLHRLTHSLKINFFKLSQGEGGKGRKRWEREGWKNIIIILEEGEKVISLSVLF